MNKIIISLLSVFILLSCSVLHAQRIIDISNELPSEWKEIEKNERSVKFSNSRANLKVERHICSECPDLTQLEQMMGIQSYKAKGATSIVNNLDKGFLYHVAEDKGVNAYLGAAVLNSEVISVRLDFWPGKESDDGKEYELLTTKLLESF